jgi:hypothetical protein
MVQVLIPGLPLNCCATLASCLIILGLNYICKVAFFFPVLGLEPRASRVLSKHSIFTVIRGLSEFTDVEQVEVCGSQ